MIEYPPRLSLLSLHLPGPTSVPRMDSFLLLQIQYLVLANFWSSRGLIAVVVSGLRLREKRGEQEGEE